MKTIGITFDCFTVTVRTTDDIEAVWKEPSGESHQAKGRVSEDEELLNTIFDGTNALREGSGEEKRWGRKEIEKLGVSLYRALFPDEVGSMFEEAVRAVKRTRRTDKSCWLRVVVEIPLKSKYFDWPLELLYCKKEELWLATAGPPVVFSRRMSLETGRRLDPAEPPLRLLVVISKPQADALASTEVCQTLEEVAQQTNGKLAEIEVCVLGQIEGYQPPRRVDYLDRPASYEELHCIIVEEGWEPHVLHFVGEGLYDDGRKEGSLILIRPTGEPGPCPSSLLADLFREWQPRVVLLQACENAKSGTESAFMYLADELSKHKIRAVVAMQFSIDDDQAGLFAAKFYEGLRRGLNVDEAVQNGRQAIWHRVLSEQPAFGTPVLFTYDPARIMPMTQSGRALDVVGGSDRYSRSDRVEGVIRILSERIEQQEAAPTDCKVLMNMVQSLEVSPELQLRFQESIRFMEWGLWDGAQESLERVAKGRLVGRSSASQSHAKKLGEPSVLDESKQKLDLSVSPGGD